MGKPQKEDTDAREYQKCDVLITMLVLKHGGLITTVNVLALKKIILIVYILARR